MLAWAPSVVEAGAGSAKGDGEDAEAHRRPAMTPEVMVAVLGTASVLLLVWWRR